jgi:hypothetical protein
MVESVRVVGELVTQEDAIDSQDMAAGVGSNLVNKHVLAVLPADNKLVEHVQGLKRIHGKSGGVA